MNYFHNFMFGRYGIDVLGKFLLAIYIVLAVVNMFLHLPILVAVSYVVIFIFGFRFISRNIYKRQIENQKFLKWIKPWEAMISLYKRKFKEKEFSRFYKCPKCRQAIRVPRGKGKIAITCPKCRHEFIKKT